MLEMKNKNAEYKLRKKFKNNSEKIDKIKFEENESDKAF